MSAYIKKADQLVEENDKKVEALKQSQLEENDRQQDERIAAAEQSTADQKAQTDEDYIDIINTADLQKELDLKNIRETRANMGLSRSGLSATEQTAAILSAGNKTAKAQRQRQAAIDALNKSLADYRIEVEDTRRSNALSINQAAEESAADFRQEAYKNVYDAEAEAVKAQQEKAEQEEKLRQTSLNALKDTVSANVLAKALANGWTVEDVEQYTNYLAGFDQAVENGIIDQEYAEAAIKEGKSVAEAQAAYNERKQKVENYATIAQGMMPTETKGFLQKFFADYNSQELKEKRDNTINYLLTLSSIGTITTAELDYIASKIGLTTEDFNNYDPSNVKENEKIINPTQFETIGPLR